MKKYRQEKSRLFLQDPLTGGYNREGFLRMCRKLLEKKGDSEYAIACLNICDFRYINEQWGADIGNKVLKLVYQVLKEKTGKKELVCRSNMDRFLLLLDEKTEINISSRITDMIETVNEIIHEKILYYNVEFYIGICMLSMEKNIEKAIGKGILVRKQNREKNVCKFYDLEIERKMKEEQEINALFAESIKNHDFKIYFQPKVSDSGACHAEALVRWIHPERGILYPDQFISLFEASGKIYELDLYVFEEVCRIVSEKLKTQKEYMKISLNVSRFTILNGGGKIWEKYRAIKEKYGISDDTLEVELTENIFVDDRQIAYIQTLLQEFHACGLKIALDDFGFAYSSLFLLKEFDIDTIKMDKRFFIDENKKSREIVKAIIQLAHNLGMCVVAEGIEEKEQVKVLQENGCDFIQGYIYSKPLSLEKFDLWKKEWENGAFQFHK